MQLPQPLKSFVMPTINVYTDKVIKPATEYNYIVFLLPTRGHSRELFLLLQRHARTRVMVRRKEYSLTTVYEDDIEYEYGFYYLVGVYVYCWHYERF